MCINSRPSRRPSVKVVNQKGSVQLGEKAAEYFLGCAFVKFANQNGSVQLSSMQLPLTYNLHNITHLKLSSFPCTSFIHINNIITRGLCTFKVSIECGSECGSDNRQCIDFNNNYYATVFAYTTHMAHFISC